MAESDAAGQPPRRPRRLTIAHVLRDVERSTAPLRALIEKAERETAPMRAAAETHAALVRKFVGEEDEGAPPPPPSESLAPAPPPPPPKPAAPPQRPPFEVDPPAGLLAALREAFPGFKPTDRWWVHVERELKDAHHRSNPEAHEAFCTAYRNWSAEDLIRHLEAEGRIPERPKGGRKHKRTVEGLDVHQWVMAMATKDRTFRHLSQVEASKLGPFSARCVGLSWAWRKMKEDLKAEADEAADRAAAELADRRGQDEDANGLRQSSTKHGIGMQRATAADLKHERDVKAFFAKAGHSGKKRTK